MGESVDIWGRVHSFNFDKGWVINVQWVVAAYIAATSVRVDFLLEKFIPTEGPPGDVSQCV